MAIELAVALGRRERARTGQQRVGVGGGGERGGDEQRRIVALARRGEVHGELSEQVPCREPFRGALTLG